MSTVIRVLVKLAGVLKVAWPVVRGWFAANAAAKAAQSAESREPSAESRDGSA